MPEIPFTSAQIRQLRADLGLKPGDYLSAGALLAMIDAAQIISDAEDEGGG